MSGRSTSSRTAPQPPPPSGRQCVQGRAVAWLRPSPRPRPRRRLRFRSGQPPVARRQSHSRTATGAYTGRRPRSDAPPAPARGAWVGLRRNASVRSRLLAFSERPANLPPHATILATTTPAVSREPSHAPAVSALGAKSWRGTPLCRQSYLENHGQRCQPRRCTKRCPLPCSPTDAAATSLFHPRGRHHDRRRRSTLHCPSCWPFALQHPHERTPLHHSQVASATAPMVDPPHHLSPFQAFRSTTLLPCPTPFVSAISRAVRPDLTPNNKLHGSTTAAAATPCILHRVSRLHCGIPMKKSPLHHSQVASVTEPTADPPRHLSPFQAPCSTSLLPSTPPWLSFLSADVRPDSAPTQPVNPSTTAAATSFSLVHACSRFR